MEWEARGECGPENNGTAYYPTHATVPTAASSTPRRTSNHGPNRSAGTRTTGRTNTATPKDDLREALERSVEADLTEALRLSVLENSGNAARQLRPAHTSSHGGYGVSREDTEYDEPGPRPRPQSTRTSYADQSQISRERNVAGAAFRDVVFGKSEPRRNDNCRIRADAREEESLREALKLSVLEHEAEQLRRAEMEVVEARKRAAEAEADAEARREREREREREEAKKMEEERKRLVGELARREERKEQMEALEKSEKEMREARSREAEYACEKVTAELSGLDLQSALRSLGFAPRDDTKRAAKQAYRKAALSFHPDRTIHKTLRERHLGAEIWKALGSKMEVFDLG